MDPGMLPAASQTPETFGGVEPGFATGGIVQAGARLDGEHGGYGSLLRTPGGPGSRASAVSLCESTASQTSQAHTASTPNPVTAEQLQRSRVEFLDQYDSRWQRDPGRPAGPFS